MSNVTLKIGGRSYSVACADGEEGHIAKLGSMIDEKFAAMGDNRAPQEVQNFLFASLILADELHEANKTKPGAVPAPAPTPAPEDSALRAEIDELRSQNEELQSVIEDARKDAAKLEEHHEALATQLEQAKAAAEAAVEPNEAALQQDMFGEDVLATRLEALATRAESFAQALEGSAPSA